MIQEEHKNKEKDLKGITRQACSLLDTAWTKGYVAGFNDGYATRREADKEAYKRPKGKWILKETDYDDGGNNLYECNNCHYCDTHSGSIEVPYCWHCGADMRGGAQNAELD